MQKINFNDRCGLTQSVIEGRKTMTRRNEFHDSEQRILNIEGVSCVLDNIGITAMHHGQIQMMIPFRYKVGEIVAVAQSYEAAGFDPEYRIEGGQFANTHTGWRNKMFVSAKYMPHQIRITGISCERLQGISDEDCIKEGVRGEGIGFFVPGIKL